MEYFTVYGVCSERQWDTVIQSTDFAARLPGFSSQWGGGASLTGSFCNILSLLLLVFLCLCSLSQPTLSLSVSFPSPPCLLLFFSLPSHSLPLPSSPFLSSLPLLLSSSLLSFSPQPFPTLLSSPFIFFLCFFSLFSAFFPSLCSLAFFYLPFLTALPSL